MTQWMDINGEGIFSTRPFTIFGEANVRFTTKGDTLYAFFLGWPDKPLTIRALAKGSPLVTGEVSRGAPSGTRWQAELLPHGRRPDDQGAGKEALRLRRRLQDQRTEGSARCRACCFHAAIKPTAKGWLQLDADAAELHGSLQVESKGDVPNIGFWDNPQDTASWDKVKFVKPGALRG